MAWAGDEAAFEGFVRRHQLTFPQLVDSDGTLFEHFGVPVQPAFVAIGTDGDATTILGSLDEDELDAALTTATTDLAGVNDALAHLGTGARTIVRL